MSLLEKPCAAVEAAQVLQGQTDLSQNPVPARLVMGPSLVFESYHGKYFIIADCYHLTLPWRVPCT